MKRIALLADIHGNSPALQAVLKDVAQQGCEQLYVLGDIINGYDPCVCVDLLRAWPGPVEAIRGNAEAYLLTPDLDEFPLRHEDMYSGLIQLLRWIEDHLTSEALAWLNGLPDTIRWDGTCLAHDSPLDRLFPERRFIPGMHAKYQEVLYHAPGIYPDTPAEKLIPLLEWMKASATSQVYIGHTHVPFIAWHGARLVCNVGSVGMPLDGDPRAVWALLEQNEGEPPVVSIRRVAYDLNTILQIVDSHPDYPHAGRPGMQQAYKKMLQTGIHWRVHMNEVNP
jgi:protein phosphatase